MIGIAGVLVLGLGLGLDFFMIFVTGDLSILGD